MFDMIFHSNEKYFEKVFELKTYVRHTKTQFYEMLLVCVRAACQWSLIDAIIERGGNIIF